MGAVRKGEIMAKSSKGDVKNGAFTPMMQQYLDIKNQHEDYILMYRLGDFYEMFFDDAKTASKELELALTGRDCGQESRAPMCGVPYHSAEGYIGRLISKGYKVAICEQTQDPAQAKGLVRREVVRMITPGTVMESSMLDEGKNNFIGAVYMDSRGGGVCFCDISTGEFYAAHLPGRGAAELIINELGRFSPRELILSDGAYGDCKIADFIKQRLECHTERGGEWRFVAKSTEEIVAKQFSNAHDLPEAMVRAAGGLLSYLFETQKNDLSYISKLNVYKQNQFMELDYTARRNLELTASLRTGDKKGSLLWALDYTKTAMGARLIRQWIERPLTIVEHIRERLFAVKAISEAHIVRDDLAELLSQIYDIERIIGRIVYGTANGRDLRALHQVCTMLPKIHDVLTDIDSRYIRDIKGRIDCLEDISLLIDSAISLEPPFTLREGGLIRDGYNEEVDRLKTLVSGGTSKLAEIERFERERTGIPKLKVGYNRVFGYYIEVSKSYMSQTPDNYIRKQTLANCERYITPELKELEGEMLSAGDRLTALEYQLFTDVREKISVQSARVQATSHAVAEIDGVLSFAVAAVKNGYTMPEVDQSDVIDIKDGRHPVVERVLVDSLFVPNDTKLDCKDNRVYIITGPNMAGKSTFMRQVALIVLMAQCGSFVPAASATIGICDRIFTRVGASDDMLAGHSTFMVEMNEVADILKNATSKSLLILDEIGRGTSTFDGMSIAKAVLEYVADKKTLGARTLFATHYHELCDIESTSDGVKNYNIVVKKRDDDIVFIKKIVRGAAGDSYGIEVAKLAGIPQVVIDRAKAVLAEIETKSFDVLPMLAQREKQREDEEGQLSMGSFAEREIVQRLKDIQPDTLSPIEALSMLYELNKRAREC